MSSDSVVDFRVRMARSQAGQVRREEPSWDAAPETDAERYLRHARQIDAVAQAVSDGDHRARMVAIASEWRRLARSAAKRARTGGPFRPADDTAAMGRA